LKKRSLTPEKLDEVKMKVNILNSYVTPRDEKAEKEKEKAEEKKAKKDKNLTEKSKKVEL
jgi:hypothetical protein